MKRLVVTGLPCPPETWEAFLGPRKQQRILPIYEVFEHSQSADLRLMSRYVTSQIESFKPKSIIAHDLGVPLVLLSLMRLAKRKVALDTKVTLFNGAFRQVNLVKANHPFRVQFMRSARAVKEVEREGGTVDLRLKKHMRRIRAMYRYIILYGLTEKVYTKLGLEELLGGAGGIPLDVPVQMIVSRNDPFIPFESIQRLREDCHARRFIELEYGHFPYTISSSKVRPLIEDFESRSH